MLVSLADVRAEGLTSGEASDSRVLATLALVAEYVRLITHQAFEVLVCPSDDPLLVDGSGIETLDLPVPILRLDSVIDGWDSGGIGQTVNLSDVRVFNRTKPVDDRRYPRLVKIAGARGVNAGTYLGHGSPAYWTRGQRNVALTGAFGYLDGRWRGTYDAGTTYAAGDFIVDAGQDYLALASSTGSAPASHADKWQTGAAPAPLRRAALLMALREYRLLTDPLYAASTLKGRVQSETTDMHSYTLAGLVSSGGFTGDPVIDDILRLYTRRGGGSTGSAW